MVTESKLGIKGFIPPTEKQKRERQKKSERLRATKKAQNPDAECLWVTGTITRFTNNEILEDIP